MKNLPNWIPYVVVVLAIAVILIVSFMGRGPKEVSAPTETPQETQIAEEVSREVPPDEAEYNRIRDIYYEGDYKKAIEEYRAFLKKYPNSEWADDAQFDIAMCYEYLGDHKKAIEEYEKLIRNYPDSEYKDSAQLSINYLKEASD